ncbi:phosphoesterase [Frankia sp. CcI156]|nr:phosphoesterase [Frankia sp. CgIS1]ONH26655.1 phosphoesterase [Frankia sp. CcI156]TFE31386.1 bifunctional oligoribonuclease/PAP phosphatase NrnA [Frankia sp. B2]
MTGTRQLRWELTMSDATDLAGPPAASVNRSRPDGAGPTGDFQAAVTALTGAIDAGDDILLIAHVNPDGDSLGSALALGLALRSLGGRPRVSFDADPFVVPRVLRFLAGQDLLVAPEAVTGRPGLVVTLDAGSRSRLGRLASTTAGCRVLVVDHHASNTRFGDLNLVDPEAASTSAMVIDLVDALGVRLDRDIATAIYTGLVTDTGSFRFAATTPAVHQLAARLVATGIRPDLISRALWDTHRFGYLKLLGEVLGRVRLEPEYDLVWSWCGQADLRAAGLEYDEIEGLIDTVRTVSEAEVALVCKQDGDVWKVSVRSKGDVDVGAVCTALGGGGHRFAAGFSCGTTLDELMDVLRDALARAPRLGGPGTPENPRGPGGPRNAVRSPR